MIKQTWNICSEEKVRILQLHENATKRLYLLNEQDPVQGPGNPNTVIGKDENFVYFISQPTQSVGKDYVDFSKEYYVYASDGNISYQCSILEKDQEGRPMNVQVLKDKPLADVRKGEFSFLFIRNKKNYDYDFGNEITKNSLVSKVGRQMFFGITWMDGKPITVMVVGEGPTYDWMFSQNNNEIYVDDLQVGSKTLFNAFTDVFVTNKGAKLSLVVPTLVTSYPTTIGKSEPEPGDVPVQTTPEPPQPVPLGDKFADNISTPTAQAILSDPRFIEFKKFVEGNDVSKFVFDIKSSASKCTAGFKEANKANGKWKDDKSVYPDVTIDPDADKNDLGNLNLTKARAQNLKNFLIANLPQLKNAQFRVVAQGSKGTCGTEEENAKNRVVDLIVTKL